MKSTDCEAELADVNNNSDLFLSYARRIDCQIKFEMKKCALLHYTCYITYHTRYAMYIHVESIAS